MNSHHFTSRHVIKSLKAKYQAKWSVGEKIANWMTITLGTSTFLLFNVVFFISWLLINTGKISFIKTFDPFPFILLTTIVSLEAIILSIFVLISQNNSNKIDELREEVDLQIDIIAETEVSKLLKLMVLLLQKNGVDLSDDRELEQMLKPINEDKIEKSLEKQIEKN